MQQKFYFSMMAMFAFAGALSNIFFNIFLWKLDETYSLLAKFSLVFAIVVLVSFPICSWVARYKSPMTTVRLGILGCIITYGLTLYYQDQLVDHIILLGFWKGISISLFAIGQHLAALDMTENNGRDRFLYILGFIGGLSGMLGPLIGGICIEAFSGIKGYYVVFAISCVLFIAAAIISFKIQSQPIGKKSEMLNVIKSPSKEWKGMLPVMLGEGIISGAFETFIIAMMTFQIAGGERNLGMFQTLSGVIGLLVSLWLARHSRPQNRFYIYITGATIITITSGFITFYPIIPMLIIFSILYPLSRNMISTTMSAWMYAAIETDTLYKQRRLDYIVVREIPLGLGRIIGVLLFLLMREVLATNLLLSSSFLVFPMVFVLMIPILSKVWKEERTQQPDAVVKTTS